MTTLLFFQSTPSSEISSDVHVPAKWWYNRRKRCRVCYRMGVRRDVSLYCTTCIDHPPLCAGHFANYHYNLGLPVLDLELLQTPDVEHSTDVEMPT